MKIKSSRLFKVIAIFICFSMLFEQSGFAQVAGQLDISGQITAFRNSLVQDKFRPLHLRYLQYDAQLNNFKTLIDKGNLKALSSSFVEQSTKTLLNYFLIGVSLSNDVFWVNLRPDAQDNIIDPLLAQTDIGKILLETDVQLKKDTARFTSPGTPEGKEYWDKLYKKAGEVFGSQNVTIPTLTRPWIVPNEIIIRESNDNAYIYKATLKVMLEEDYLKGSAVYNFEDERAKELNTYAAEVLREKIIPKLTQEINTSKRYAGLRQVYYSLILAQWFKQRFKGQLPAVTAPNPYVGLIDSNRLAGLISQDSWSKNTYFQQYQKSFKDGEYNFKVPVSTPYGQVIRSYFSGGIMLGGTGANSIVGAMGRGGFAGGSRNIFETIGARARYVAALLLKGSRNLNNPADVQAEGIALSGIEPSVQVQTPALVIQAGVAGIIKNALGKRQGPIDYADVGSGPRGEFEGRLLPLLQDAGLVVRDSVSVDKGVTVDDIDPRKVKKIDVAVPAERVAAGLADQSRDLVTINNIIFANLVSPVLAILRLGGVCVITFAAKDLNNEGPYANPKIMEEIRAQIQEVSDGDPAYDYQVEEVDMPQDYPASNSLNTIAYASHNKILIVTKHAKTVASVSTTLNLNLLIDEKSWSSANKERFIEAVLKACQRANSLISREEQKNYQNYSGPIYDATAFLSVALPKELSNMLTELFGLEDAGVFYYLNGKKSVEMDGKDTVTLFGVSVARVSLSSDGKLLKVDLLLKESDIETIRQKMIEGIKNEEYLVREIKEKEAAQSNSAPQLGAPRLAGKINGKFVQVNKNGEIIVNLVAIAAVLGVSQDSPIVVRVAAVIRAHELAEDAALARGLSKQEAHTEGVMAEAEAIGQDEELRQAMHRLWDTLDANRSAKAAIEYGGLDAWGKMEEGYEGEGVSGTILKKLVVGEEFQAFIKRTGVKEGEISQLLRKFLEDNVDNLGDGWSSIDLLSLQLKFSDSQKEMEGNLTRLNSYIADSVLKYGTVYLRFAGSLKNAKNKTEFNTIFNRWITFIDLIMNELKGMNSVDLYAPQIFDNLINIMRYVSVRIADETKRKQELDTFFSYVLIKTKEIKHSVALQYPGGDNTENLSSYFAVNAVKNSLVNVYQFLRRTNTDRLAEAYKPVLDFASDFIARRGEHLFQDATGGSHGLSSAIAHSDTPEELKQNVAALNRFLILSETRLKNNIPEHIIYNFMQRLADMLKDKEGGLFAVYMDAISELIQALDAQDAQTLFSRSVWVSLFEIASRLSSDPANLKVTFLELASLLKEMSASGIYLESAEYYLRIFNSSENNITGLKQKVSALLSFRNKISGQFSDKDSKTLVNLVLQNVVRHFSSLPARDFSATLDSLSDFILGVLSIGNKRISEVLIENLRYYQKIISNKEKVAVALDIVRSGFIPTERLVDYAIQVGNVQLAIAEFERIKADIANGGFKLDEIKDAMQRNLYIEVEYSHFVNVLLESGFGLSRLDYASYKEFISGVHRPGEVHLDASGMAEIDYAIYEAKKLLDFIDKLITQAKTINREVVVVANMSYGGFVLDIIEGELTRRGIKMIRTKIGSTESHQNPWVFREDLFNENDLLYITTNRPVMVVIDGTQHLVDREGDGGKRGRYPDAYQGYRNFVLAFNEALAGVSNDREMSYRKAIGKDEGFIASFGESFSKLKNKIIAMLKGMQVSRDYYDFKFWNPGGLKSILRENRQPLAEADNFRPEQLRGTAVIFANTVLVDEEIPVVLKSVHANYTHEPAHYDDNNVIKEIFLSVTDRGTQFEKKLGPIIKSRYPVVMGILQQATSIAKDGQVVAGQAGIQAFEGASGQVATGDLDVLGAPADAAILALDQGALNVLNIRTLDNGALTITSGMVTINGRQIRIIINNRQDAPFATVNANQEVEINLDKINNLLKDSKLTPAERQAALERILIHDIAEAYALQLGLNAAEAHIAGMMAEAMHPANSQNIRDALSVVLQERDARQAAQLKDGLGFGGSEVSVRLKNLRSEISKKTIPIKLISLKGEISADKISENDPASIKIDEEIAQTIRNRQVIELDLRALAKESDPYKALFNSFSHIAFVLRSTLSQTQYDAQEVVDELLSNAFVHGNKLDFNLPIFIKFQGTLNNSDVYNLEVYDLADSKEMDSVEYEKAKQAALTGRGRGVRETIEGQDWDYSRKELRDNKGEQFATVVNSFPHRVDDSMAPKDALPIDRLTSVLYNTADGTYEISRFIKDSNLSGDDVSLKALGIKIATILCLAHFSYLSSENIEAYGEVYFESFKGQNDVSKIVIVNGRIVAFSRSLYLSSRKMWKLADLFVLPEYQGGGMGRDLLDQSIESIANTKTKNGLVPKFFLQQTASPETQKFYRLYFGLDSHNPGSSLPRNIPDPTGKRSWQLKVTPGAGLGEPSFVVDINNVEIKSETTNQRGLPFGKLKFVEAQNKLNDYSVWCFEDENGVRWWMRRVFKNEEIFSYKLAEASGVNVPRHLIVQLSDLSFDQNNPPRIQEGVVQLKGSKVLLSRDVNTLLEGELMQKTTSGAEELIAFAIWVPGVDIGWMYNMLTPQIPAGGARRYIAYNVKVNARATTAILDGSETNLLENILLHGRPEITAQQFDLAIANIEKIDTAQIRRLAVDSGITGVDLKNLEDILMQRRDNLRAMIVEALRKAAQGLSAADAQKINKLCDLLSTQGKSVDNAPQRIIREYLEGVPGAETWFTYPAIEVMNVDPIFREVAARQGGRVLIAGGSDLAQILLGLAKTNIYDGMTEVNLLLDRADLGDFTREHNEYENVSLPAWQERPALTLATLMTNAEASHGLIKMMQNMREGNSVLHGWPQVNVPLIFSAIVVVSARGPAQIYFRTQEDYNNWKAHKLTLLDTSDNWENDPINKDWVPYVLQYSAINYARGKVSGWSFEENSLRKIRQMVATLTLEQKVALVKDIRDRMQTFSLNEESRRVLLRDGEEVLIEFGLLSDASGEQEGISATISQKELQAIMNANKPLVGAIVKRLGEDVYVVEFTDGSKVDVNNVLEIKSAILNKRSSLSIKDRITLSGWFSWMSRWQAAWQRDMQARRIRVAENQRQALDRQDSINEPIRDGEFEKIKSLVSSSIAFSARMAEDPLGSVRNIHRWNVYFKNAGGSYIIVSNVSFADIEKLAKVYSLLDANPTYDEVVDYVVPEYDQEKNSKDGRVRVVFRDGSVIGDLKYNNVESAIRNKSISSGPKDQGGKGGIDFRALPIVTQPMINNQIATGDNLRSSVSPIGFSAGMFLDKEWQQIGEMLNAGIIPSVERIKEYIKVACKAKDCQDRIDRALNGIADILRLEEERPALTDGALKQVLVLLESNRSVLQIELALANIQVSPKEPMLVK